MNARKGCWTIPQLLLDLEARVKALEESNVTLYEHNIQMMVAQGASPVANPRLTIYNNNASQFTAETILEYISIAKAKSVSGTYNSKGIVWLADVSENVYRVGFDDGSILDFDSVIAISDEVVPVTLALQH